MSLFPILAHSAHRLGLERHLRREAPKLEGSVLDVGSKDRRYDKLFSGKVTACDAVADPDKKVIKADIHALPFKADEFSNTVCFEVLEYTHTPATALAELVRVTKPGGTILISIPFMTYFHDDNLRLTENWFIEQLNTLPVSYTLHTIGGAYAVMVDILRRKTIDQPSRVIRFLLYPLLWVSSLFLSLQPARDRRFASGYFIVMTKETKK
jgi:SAM-dependent methyltransferase